MENIIGLGNAGCNIAEEFSKYPQYNTYKIDTNITGDNCFAIDKKQTTEEYEKNVPDLKNFFKDVSGDVLFIVGGGGKISGATLQILKQIRHCNINILYIKPDIKSLTKTGVLQNRAVFNILQEYARSGILKKIFLVDNLSIEKIIGDVPILEYNSKMNNIIVNAIHYYNVFSNTDPILENFESPRDIQRICTIGTYDLKNNYETPFFPLQNVGHKCYYYAIPDDVLKSDGKLFKMIKEKAAEDHSSYQIYTTKHQEMFSFFIAYTNFIQTVDNN